MDEHYPMNLAHQMWLRLYNVESEVHSDSHRRVVEYLKTYAHASV